MVTDAPPNELVTVALGDELVTLELRLRWWLPAYLAALALFAELVDADVREDHLDWIWQKGSYFKRISCQ